MKSNLLENIKWYHDANAEARQEPGIYHSFLKCLATALSYIEGNLDPVALMGNSAFAFRIFINEKMCPSAMSVFDFSTLLPAAIEQAGYQAIYIARYWNEAQQEPVKQAEAHAAIVEGINRSVPAIVWDIAAAEWGLITGYDLENKTYHALSHNGQPAQLPFEKLGHNGINILSVTIPGTANQRPRSERLHNAVRAAVHHAEQKEWMDRPQYQDGLPAYDLWASLLEKWAMIAEAGREKNLNPEIRDFATYYAGHHYSARCYAREYLKSMANGNEWMLKAASCYEDVASALKPVWDYFSQANPINANKLNSLSADIKRAKIAEAEGINFLKKYLNNV